MAELQSGYQIQKLRIDSGGEYTSLDFQSFCDHLGLERQLTVAYSPKQNGVSEGKNMTIIEMAKNMLLNMKLPYDFWGEASNTVVYLLNRCQLKLCRTRIHWKHLVIESQE